ncbi:MAG: hypothetical protein JWQ04_1390 [Pedosphaera sp.]|nr:hypothetical protein [Pedosphaera sp.]
MKELSADSWKRQGSSVIWDKDTLQTLLPIASLVSLRTFLSWHDTWPAQLPRNSRTILVGGLQTCLELLSPAEGAAFLLNRVQTLISRQQSKMEQVGVVFAFHNATHRAFDVTQRDEEISYKRTGQPLMPLSVPLWGRGSSADIHLVLRSGQPREPIGYYVRRIS